jgi:hypothetical protein
VRHGRAGDDADRRQRIELEAHGASEDNASDETRPRR